MTLLKYGPFSDVDDMPGIRQMQDTFSRFFDRTEFPSLDTGGRHSRNRERARR